MELPFFAADTLGVTLLQTKSKLVAHEVHQIKFGSWRLELDIQVESDCIGSTELSFWVTVAKRLQMYLIVKSAETFLIVLDEDKLKECEAKTRFEGQTVKARAAELKPAVKTIFRWRNQSWERLGGQGDWG